MSKQRIAVLDEDRRAREDWRLKLPGSVEVNVFSSEDEFLQSAKSEDYDCLLLETSVARRLHLHLLDEGVKAPVIYLAVHASVPEAVAAVKLGAADYLCKPVASAELVSAIEKAGREKRWGVPEHFWRTEVGLETKLDGLERELICAALARAQGVVGGRHGAAAMLGVTRTGLLYKMKRLGISRGLIAPAETMNMDGHHEGASAAASEGS